MTTLTDGMVYLEHAGGRRGRTRYQAMALQLVEVARRAPSGRARVRLATVTASAVVVGDLWGVVVHRADYHHAASDARRVLDILVHM